MKTMRCVVKCVGRFGSMDRLMLEGWLLSNGIAYHLGAKGDIMARLTDSEVNSLRDEGWTVRVLE